MRWSWWVGAVPVLILACGCGTESYNKRLDQTIAQMKREFRYSKNLEKAPGGEKTFVDLKLFVRAPKGETLNKRGALPVPEGQYELDSSFVDKGNGAALHVMARVKLPKKPLAKGQNPAPASAPRGDFNRDTLDILTSQFGPEAFATPKFAPEQKGENRFNRLVTTANGQEIKVYTYKKDNTEAALIFVYDPKLRGTLADKIDDSLTTFATGAKAGRLYANNGTDPGEDGDAPPATAL